MTGSFVTASMKKKFVLVVKLFITKRANKLASRMKSLSVPLQVEFSIEAFVAVFANERRFIFMRIFDVPFKTRSIHLLLADRTRLLEMRENMISQLLLCLDGFWTMITLKISSTMNYSNVID
jgi:hypothetical protein